MLLIAQPKSASTSLLDTLGRITGLKGTQYFISQKIFEPEFFELSKLHTDACGIGYETLNSFINNQKVIYKQHFVPNDNNLKCLSKINKKIVVLLRNPLDCIDAYINNGKYIIGYYNLPKIFDEMKLYYDRYVQFSEINKNIVLIDYNVLILDTEKTIEKILNHFNLRAITNDWTLSRKRFTGKGLKKLGVKNEYNNN